MSEKLKLDHYRQVGRSGLRVSPLSLGTMTFGTDWGVGADVDEARRIFDTYVDRGGNFIDTANVYTNGTSETFLGRFSEGKRDRLVIASKYSAATDRGDPNSGGNHRKSMVRSLEGSLKRLNTDYLDVLYLHLWDGSTPVEEILRAFDDLVSSGKVLYVAISDTPAWQVSRMQAIASLRGWAPLIALQIEYNLLERTVERELIPMAREMGLGVVPWSPLAGGVLTGKYSRADLEAPQAASAPKGDPNAAAGKEMARIATGGGRRSVNLANGNLTEANLAIADEVASVARELEATPAQVALAWTLLEPGVVSPIVGTRNLSQLEDNLGALDVVLTPEHAQRLNAVSHTPAGFPHELIGRPAVRELISGGATLR